MQNSESGASAGQGAKRAAGMSFILITVLIDMVAIGLIIPVLPLVVGTFTSSPAEQTWWYGAVTITFGIANFFASKIPVVRMILARVAKLARL